MATPEFPLPPPDPITAELVELTNSIGEAWACECMRTLEQQERGVVGAWPGTLREARSHLLARMPAHHRATAMADLDTLARAVYAAARRSWDAICEPDPEP